MTERPDTSAITRILWRGLRSRRRFVLTAALLAIVLAVLAVATMLVIHGVFATALPEHNTPAVVLLCGGAIGLRFVAAAASFLQRRTAAVIARGVGADLRRDLVTQIMHQPSETWIEHDHRWVSARFVHGTERIDNLLYRVFSAMVPAACAGLIIGAGLVWLNWQLTVAGILISPLAVVTQRIAQKRSAVDTAEFQQAFEDVARDSAFLFSHHALTRHRGYEQQEINRIGSTIDTLSSRAIAMTSGFARVAASQAFMTSVIALILMATGSILVIEGTTSAASVLAFYTGAVLLAGTVTQAGSAFPEIASGLESIRRLSEPPFDGQPTAEPTGELCEKLLPLQLSRVDIGHDDVLISGVDLQVSAGNHVVLRGANGSGKTTLLETILGLRPPLKGLVSAAGRRFDDLDPSSIRRRVGYVAQRPLLFHGSIADNLRYGRPGASIDELSSALDVVLADRWISELPEGIDTVIGDAGSRLSGGQAQQLAIARGLIGGPEMLVLDEPGNHLAQGLLPEILDRIAAAHPAMAIVTATHDADVISSADEHLLEAGSLVDLSRS
ncbi:ABC transporter ATP-binding protein [Smaragdicoccus niigatensis]|uniref:ABC transporter ATP-binding protein n=1 Tax=Smaragdicoccus niigatensis TaxID=359359 RepID=UPI00138ACB0F|nr:ABC transporter ATP-binding protein [Smaragdicoccus niigatensis]